MPTLDQLAVADVKTVVSDRHISQSDIEKLVNPMPVISNFISTEAFYDACVSIHQNTIEQRNTVASCEHHTRRGMMQNAVCRMYSDNVHEVEQTGTTYADWFATRNIDIDSFDKEDLEIMYQSLVREATGLSLNTTQSLKDLQAAMLKMLKQLSSYSIQLVGDIHGDGITRVDPPVVRVGDIDGYGRGRYYYPLEIIDVKSYKGHGHMYIPYNLSTSNATDIKGYGRGKHNIKVGVKIKANGAGVSGRIKINVVTMRATQANPIVPIDPTVIAVPGTEFTQQLNRLQLGELKSPYTGDYSAGPATDYIDHDYVVGGYIGNVSSTLPSPYIGEPVILTPLDNRVLLTTDLTITTKPYEYFGNHGGTHTKTIVEVYEAYDGWAGPETEPNSGTLIHSAILTTGNLLQHTVPSGLIIGYMGSTKELHVRVKYVDDNARYSSWSSFLHVFFSYN